MGTLCLWRSAAACRRSLTISSILFFFLMLAQLARAASGATLAGGVTDPDGRGVASARVIVTNALGTVTGAVTDSGGAYEIAGLAAGTGGSFCPAGRCRIDRYNGGRHAFAEFRGKCGRRQFRRSTDS